jgi:hypothetical protein
VRPDLGSQRASLRGAARVVQSGWVGDAQKLAISGRQLVEIRALQ